MRFDSDRWESGSIAGERIRVQVTSNDFPQWDRNLNTGNSPGSEGLASAIVATQAIYHDAEHPSEHHAASLDSRLTDAHAIDTLRSRVEMPA